MIDNLKDWLGEVYPGLILADGFEDAFLGVCEQRGDPTAVACYDYNKCIDILISRDGMTYEEAEEYFSFKVSGAHIKNGPIYLITISRGLKSGREVKEGKTLADVFAELDKKEREGC